MKVCRGNQDNFSSRWQFFSTTPSPPPLKYWSGTAPVPVPVSHGFDRTVRRTFYPGSARVAHPRSYEIMFEKNSKPFDFEKFEKSSSRNLRDFTRLFASVSSCTYVQLYVVWVYTARRVSIASRGDVIKSTALGAYNTHVTLGRVNTFRRMQIRSAGRRGAG